MRDPRRRLQGRGGDSDGPAVGRTMPEEDAMTAAVDAMGRAVVSLDALKTGDALPPEMQALNALLEAQALVKKRQVSRQQSAQGGPGNNNRNYDISSLFDKELQRLQETRYETRQPAADRNEQNDALDKIAELARRQDELLKSQQELARQRQDEPEVARQLEKLSREQADLRQQAEELARRMSKLESGQQNRSGPPTGSSSAEQTARQLREIADDMRSAVNDLRRRDSTQRGSGGSQALDKLKALERRLRGGGGDRQTKASDPRRDSAGAGTRPGDDSQAISELRGRAQQLRQDIERLTRDLEKLGQQDANRQATPRGQPSPGQQGKPGEPRETDTNGRGDAVARLRDQAARELQRTRELLDELRRQDPALAAGGTGFTFEGAGMVFSSPGTEAFKQDLAKWQTLSAEATRALERAESSLSKRLQDQDASERLAAGVEDRAPEAYQQRVDRYFKALGNRRP